MQLQKGCFLRKKGKKPYFIGVFVLFRTILNRTISGIVLSEIILSGDPLHKSKVEIRANLLLCLSYKHNFDCDSNVTLFNHFSDSSFSTQFLPKIWSICDSFFVGIISHSNFLRINVTNQNKLSTKMKLQKLEINNAISFVARQ